MQKMVLGANDMAQEAAPFLHTLARGNDSATVVALSGELGAGKTVFARAIAKALGVEETVNSPTFVIEKIYALSGQQWQRLIHIDAYRLKNADELRTLGWDELIADTHNLIVVEWPENVVGAIPNGAHRIMIDVGEGETRTIHYG